MSTITNWSPIFDAFDSIVRNPGGVGLLDRVIGNAQGCAPSDLLPFLHKLGGGLSQVARDAAAIPPPDTTMPDPFLSPTHPRFNPVNVQMRPFQALDPTQRPQPPVLSLLNTGRFSGR